MNKQDLIEKYKNLEGVWNANGAEIARQCFLRDLEQLRGREREAVYGKDESNKTTAIL